MVVPELPQSNGSVLATRPFQPSPSIRRGDVEASLSAASHVKPGTSGFAEGDPDQSERPERALGATCARQLAVDRTSSALGRPVNSLAPSATAASINHRCAIDLSPGTLTSVLRRAEGLTWSRIGVQARRRASNPPPWRQSSARSRSPTAIVRWTVPRPPSGEWTIWRSSMLTWTAPKAAVSSARTPGRSGTRRSLVVVPPVTGDRLTLDVL